MTNEPQWVSEETFELGYVQLRAPGIDFSVIRLPLPTDDEGADATVARAVSLARKLYDAWHNEFNKQPQDAPAGPRVEVLHNGNVNDAPLPDEPYAPSEPVRVPLDERGNEPVRTVGQQRRDPAGESWACHDCHQKAVPSIEKYQQWDVAPDGVEYAAKWRCVNEQCATKSLWRSKLIPLAPVGAR